MFLCTSVLLAVLVALIRGGEWQNLSKYKFKKSWLAFFAIALQLLIFNPLWDKYIDSDITTSTIYVFSILIILLFLVVNTDLSGLRILGLGILSNGIAIVANGGNMPSSLEALKKIAPPETINHLESGSAAYNAILITDETRFRFLCDIFYIPGINVYSVGDLLIAAGAFVAIQQIMLRRKVIML